MAASDTITPEGRYKYEDTLWGESIYGTKEQIQRLGIAVDMAFPGEPGGPKRCLNVIDPRGFKTSIRCWPCDGVYSVGIHFPGRSRPDAQWHDYAPGVQLRTDSTWFDEYVGTAEALAAAGLLVLLDQLPGQPGMRKVIVTIFADGTFPQGTLRAKYKRSDEPGTKTIRRASTTTYSVQVNISGDEKERRQDASHRAEREYAKRMTALPRPPRLDGKTSDGAQSAFAVTTPGDYRDRVRTMSAMAFGMIERWMFNDEAAPFSFAPEERERLLAHTKSIWQDLSRLIDQGKIVRTTTVLRPALRLIRNDRFADRRHT